MNTENSPHLQDFAPLRQRVAPEAGAAEVAAALVALCSAVDSALQPIIGQRGVLALFKRSVHLTAEAHPWLAASGQSSASELDFIALENLFARQTAAAALSCGNQLLLNFHQLLASLIGASLKERLLQSAWELPIGASPTQDPSS